MPKLYSDGVGFLFWFTGERLFLHCEAFANCDTDLALIYWLVNGSFSEDGPSRGRIVESEEWVLNLPWQELHTLDNYSQLSMYNVRLESYWFRTDVCSRSTLEDGSVLHKSLLLKNVTLQDFKSTFTCVVTNAAGMDLKHITFTQKSSDCHVRNHRRHWMVL